jgi:hypothetical protein
LAANHRSFEFGVAEEVIVAVIIEVEIEVVILDVSVGPAVATMDTDIEAGPVAGDRSGFHHGGRRLVNRQIGGNAHAGHQRDCSRGNQEALHFYPHTLGMVNDL